MPQLVLDAQQLSYRRRRQFILHECDLALYPREVVALLGRNGAGKTTLLHLLAGMKTPTGGKINYHFDNNNHFLGYLPDKAPLYPTMRVVEYLRYCAKIRQLDDIDAAVMRVLQLCELEAVKQTRCRALSHGFQQRVGLAQALIHQPTLIFLDEPTNGLDYGQKQALRPLLAGLAQSASVLMISHDYEEVIATAQRVYYLDNGLCYQLQLPPVEDYLWATFADKPNTLPQTPTIDEGRFVGFACAEDAQAALRQKLADLPQLQALSCNYPPAALQARLNHVA